MVYDSRAACRPRAPSLALAPKPDGQWADRGLGVHPTKNLSGIAASAVYKPTAERLVILGPEQIVSRKVLARVRSCEEVNRFVIAGCLVCLVSADKVKTNRKLTTQHKKFWGPAERLDTTSCRIFQQRLADRLRSARVLRE